MKNVAFWFLAIIVVLFAYKFMQKPSTGTDLLDSARFTEALRAGKVAKVSLPREATIEGDFTPDSDAEAAHFLIVAPAYRELVDDLLQRHVTIKYQSHRDSTLLTTALSWIPILVLIGAWTYFMRSMQATSRKAESQPGSSVGS